VGQRMGIFNACARWKINIMCGTQYVPDDLYPSHKDEAERILMNLIKFNKYQEWPLLNVGIFDIIRINNI
jgi:hypothetical protein